MKLLTDEQTEKLPQLYSTENILTKDKIVKIKFFTPDSNWSWYVVEYDKYEKAFFGFVNGHYIIPQNVKTTFSKSLFS